MTALLLSAGVAFASDGVTYDNGTWRPSNEMSFSYGRASLAGCAYTLGGFFGTVFSFGLAAPSEMWTTGAFGLEYMNYIHPHVGVGGLVTYECCALGFKSYAGKDEEGNAIYKDGGNVDYNHIISIMPAFKFPWMAFEHVSLYSKVALGIMITGKTGHTEVDSEGNEETVSPSVAANFICQVNPVGVDFGGLHHRGFVELGFGAQGLIMAGYRIAF